MSFASPFLGGLLYAALRSPSSGPAGDFGALLFGAGLGSPVGLAAILAGFLRREIHGRVFALGLALNGPLAAVLVGQLLLRAVFWNAD